MSDAIISAEESARARINRAIRSAESLAEQLEVMRANRDMHHMKKIRSTVESINQCVHEYNAYMNIYLMDMGQLDKARANKEKKKSFRSKSLTFFRHKQA